MAQIGAVELWAPYGGGIEFIKGGDFLLARDDDGSYTATYQWLARLVNTSPLLKDSNGNAIGRPDDIYHVNWGGGLPALIGENIDTIQANAPKKLLDSIMSSPRFDTAFPPQVSVYEISPGQVGVDIVAKVASGDIYTFPTIIVGA